MGQFSKADVVSIRGATPASRMATIGVGAVTPAESQVTVTNVQTLVKAANALRKNLIIENFGTVAVYLFFTTGGFANASVLLPQYGVWSALQEGLLITSAIYGQTGSSSTIVGVSEET